MKLWVPNAQQVWRLATVVSTSDDTVTVSGLNNSPDETYSQSECNAYDFSHGVDCEDLSKLNNLGEAPLLNSLRRRFEGGKIYTNCGDVLLSINPYETIPFLYEFDEEKRYQDESGAGSDPSKDVDDSDSDGDDDWRIPDGEGTNNRPHVYSVGERSLASLKSDFDLKNQSIIISGESGAGKTEAAKHVMRYLINESSKIGGASQADTDTIQSSIMSSNVILESFGNAKTVRNNNSSRFGKYIKMIYDTDYRIVGACTEHFLLEKSRLVHIENGERNYHFFYQLLAGLDETKKQTLKLKEPKDYVLLNQGKCTSVSEDVDDGVEFENTMQALKNVNISGEEIDQIHTLVAALLHLGNVDFPEDASRGQFLESVFKKSDMQLEEVAGILGCTPEELNLGFTQRQVTSGRNSMINVPLDKAQALANVKGMIKYVYGAIFEYLVNKINDSHDVASRDHGTTHGFIGILDIFGFEIFKQNSFEQLCINFANECLQNQFNHQIFVLEKVAYDAEGIDSSVINFKDNQSVIDLIKAKPSGLFITLEEHCLMNRKADNKALLRTYYTIQSESFSKPRFGEESFVVKHFAGDVEYQVGDFIEKNNDALSDELLNILKKSANKFVADLMKEPENDEEAEVDGQGDEVSSLPTPPPSRAQAMRERQSVMRRRTTNGGGGKGMAALNTVSFVFRHQLDMLTATLRKTTPHYIKCIKPNSAKAAKGFSPTLVIEQLRYSGVLEVVRIRREGYPTRMSYPTFFKKYEILAYDNPKFRGQSGVADEDISRAASAFICSDNLEVNDFQCGKLVLFLRDDVLRKLASCVRSFYQAKATKIVSKIRMKLCMNRYKKAKDSAGQLQALARMMRKKKQFAEEKQQMVRIQSIMRGKLERKGYLVAKREKEMKEQAATKIAASRRMMREQKEFLKQLEAVKKIEATFRMHEQKVEFEKDKKKAIVLEAAFRGYKQRKDRALQIFSAARIQVAVRSFLRNAKLVADVIALHSAARQGDIAKFKEIYLSPASKDNSLGQVRYKYDHYKTIMQTISKTGNTAMMQVVNPSYEEILSQDSLGNSSMHYAAGSARVEGCKFLSGAINSALQGENHSQKVGLKKALRKLQSQRSASADGDDLRSTGGGILCEGWLRKHKVGKGSDKRYCKLTRKQLTYFKRKGDKKPTKIFDLEVAMIKHSTESTFCFELHSPLLLDKKNPHGRMYFECENEMMFQTWMSALRNSLAQVAMEMKTVGVVEKTYSIRQALRTIVKAKNKQGKTPLHLVAEHEPRKYAQVNENMACGKTARKRLSVSHVLTRQETAMNKQPSSRVITVATFLIEGGCNIDEKDIDGNTPVKYAVMFKHYDLAAALVRKGADMSIKGNDGKSALDMLDGADVIDKVCNIKRIGLSEQLPLLPPPEKVFGCTYFSFTFEKMNIPADVTEEDRIERPVMKISVYAHGESEDKLNKRGGLHVVEKSQCISLPMVINEDYVFWGSTFHLQAALEDLVGGFAIFELVKKDGSTVVWGRMELDLRDTQFDTGPKTVEMNSGPTVDLTMQKVERSDYFVSGQLSLTKLE